MSSSAQHNLDFIPRSVKSSSNIRKFNNSRVKKSLNCTGRLQQDPKVKFKQIPHQLSQKSIKQEQVFPPNNQLDNKYNVYKYGSPNFYSYNLENHKANNIKNQIQTLDLPFIDNVIRELKSSNNGNNNSTNSMKQNTANMRDLQLYPNLLKTHQTHKFKELLSDKQQLKDFLKWFEQSYQNIESKPISIVKKFHQKQIIISTAFSQITQQINRLSKPRSQILKMLWNKQNHEVQQIIHDLTSKAIDIQKDNLITLSKCHQQYQKEIDMLKKQNQELKKKLNQEVFINKGYVNTLRCNRKMLRKEQLVIRKLIDCSENLTAENLNLLDQNTKLLINNHQLSLQQLNDDQNNLIVFKKNQKSKTSANIQKRKDSASFLRCSQSSQSTVNGNNFQQYQQQQSCFNLNNNRLSSHSSSPSQSQLKYSQARILLYRRLQISTKLSSLHSSMSQLKKSFSQQLKKQSEKQLHKPQHQLSYKQIQQKKQQLYQYLIMRFQENPNQKLFLKDDMFHQDDHNLQFAGIQQIVRKLCQCREIVEMFKNEGKISEEEKEMTGVKEVGVNTVPIRAEECKKKHDRNELNLIQYELQKEASGSSSSAQSPNLTNNMINLLGTMGIQKVWQQHQHHHQKKIRESHLQTRNSLLHLQLQTIKSFANGNNLKSQQAVRQQQSDVQQSFQHQATKSSTTPYNNKSPGKNINSDSAINFKQLQNEIQKFNSLSNQQNLQSNTKSLNISSLRSPQKHLNKVIGEVWNQLSNDHSYQPYNKNLNKLHQMQFTRSKTTTKATTFLKQIYSATSKLFKSHPNSSHSTSKKNQQKLFTFLQTLKYFQNQNDVCLIAALFLKISNKFRSYIQKDLISQELVKMYFEMWEKMRITQKQFVWMPLTSLSKLKSQNTQIVLQKYFSKVYLLQLNHKLQELITYCKQSAQLPTKFEQTQTGGERKIPLNSILLYLMEIYLIEKQKYKQSYQNYLKFFIEEEDNGKLQGNSVIYADKWSALMRLFKCQTEDQQSKLKQGEKKTTYTQNDFYKTCILNDLPLFDQRSVSIQCSLKHLPHKISKQFQLNLFNNPASLKRKSSQLFQEIKKWQNICKILENQFSESKNLNKQEEKGMKRLLNKMKLYIAKRKQQDMDGVQMFALVYKFMIWTVYLSGRQQLK